MYEDFLDDTSHGIDISINGANITEQNIALDFFCHFF